MTQDRFMLYGGFFTQVTKMVIRVLQNKLSMNVENKIYETQKKAQYVQKNIYTYTKKIVVAKK